MMTCKNLLLNLKIFFPELNATTEQPNEISEILLKITDKHWWDALFKVLKHIEKSPTASLTEKGIEK